MKSWLTRWGSVTLSLLPLPFLILVANPALILVDAGNFTVPLLTWAALLTAAVVFSLAVALPMSLLGDRVGRALSVAFRSAFIVLFLVTVFYPEGGRRLDGVQAETPALGWLIRLYAVYLLLWIGTVAVYRYRRDVANGIFVLALVCSIGVTAFVIPMRMDGGHDEPPPEVSYGQDLNVVFMLADMLQGSTVEQIFNHRPELRADFEGFHVYSRALSPFPFTNYGLPAILSGKLYSADPSLGHLENLEAARSDSFVTDARQSGYEISVSGFDELPISATQYSYPREESPYYVAATLMELSLTRLTKLPGVLEEQSAGERMIIKLKRESLQELERMITAPVGDASKRLLVHHNFVPHSPNYYRVENLSQPKLDWRAQPLDIPNYLEETEFFLRKLSELVQHLRDLDVYDQTLIVVTGDHGHFVGEQPRLYESVPGAESFVGYERGKWARAAAMYNPAILIKPPASDAPIRITHDPISVMDLRGIIRRYVQDEAPNAIDEELRIADARPNDVVVFTTDAADPYRSAADHVHLEVAGNADELARRFVHDQAPLGTYAAGSTLAPANGLMDGNWVKEEQGAWLRGHVGRMRFTPQGLAGGPLRLTVVATPLLSPEHKRQRVEVSINGTSVGQMEFTRPKQEVSLTVPDSIITGATEDVMITFDPLDAVSPAELGLWATQIPISIYIYSFVLTPDVAQGSNGGAL